MKRKQVYLSIFMIKLKFQVSGEMIQLIVLGKLIKFGGEVRKFSLRQELWGSQNCARFQTNKLACHILWMLVEDTRLLSQRQNCSSHRISICTSSLSASSNRWCTQGQVTFAQPVQCIVGRNPKLKELSASVIGSKHAWPRPWTQALSLLSWTTYQPALCS